MNTDEAIARAAERAQGRCECRGQCDLEHRGRCGNLDRQRLLLGGEERLEARKMTRRDSNLGPQHFKMLCPGCLKTYSPAAARQRSSRALTEDARSFIDRL